MTLQGFSAPGGQNRLLKWFQNPVDRNLSIRPTPRASGFLVRAGGNLAIVDEFTRKGISMTAQEQSHQLRAAASHGQVVEAHARMANPALNIHRFQVPYNRLTRQWDVRAALRQLEKELENGKVIDSVNLSFGESVTIEGLKKDFRLSALNADNLNQYRDLILRDFHKVKINRPRELASLGLIGQRNRTYVKDCIDTIERIAEKDIPVFIAAGNAGPKRFNLLSLAKGTTAVGAKGLQHFKPGSKKAQKSHITTDKADYSGDNALVTRWAPSTKRFVAVMDKQGKVLGFTLKDINSRKQMAKRCNEKVLLPLETLRTQTIGGHWTDLKNARVQNSHIWGTSFASPQVAAKAAKQQAAWRTLKEVFSKAFGLAGT